MSEQAPAPWGKLDRRTTVATAIRATGTAAAVAVPVAIGIAGGSSLGVALLVVLPVIVLLFLAVIGVETVRVRRTRYRISPDMVELETGLVFRRRRVLQLDRIRAVDITADPIARVFGLAKAAIGTGEQQSGTRTLTLHFVTAAVGEQLRARLLDRPGFDRPGVAEDRNRLAQLDPSWIRYAPISFLTPVLGFTAAGIVMQVADWLGLAPDFVAWIGDLFDGVPIVVMILVLIALSLVVGLVGSLGYFVEMWWRYQLDREPGGTVRVRRGLFTTRSISLEERRLRGVEIVEPLGVRFAGAARVDAVATGMAKQDDPKKSDHHTLLPAAPLAVARRVSGDILRDRDLWSHTEHLIPHPRAARNRRVRWSLLSVLAVVVVLTVLGIVFTDVLLYVAALTAVVCAPAALWLALDAYRSLGHALADDYVLARSGTVRRATVALQRRGIIGWTAKQSIFQRRQGLMTIAFTTAAGAGAYRIIDVGESEGLAFAESVLPDLFTPFLERDPDPGSGWGSGWVGASPDLPAAVR